jgi:protease II
LYYVKPKFTIYQKLKKHFIEAIVILAQAAKRISPLKNALFHEWNDRVRQHSLLTEERLITTMNNEWYNTKEENIKYYCDHCGIARGQNGYKDCSFPLNQHHSS